MRFKSYSLCIMEIAIAITQICACGGGPLGRDAVLRSCVAVAVSPTQWAPLGHRRVAASHERPGVLALLCCVFYLCEKLSFFL